jgi:hypothetical protein
MLTQQSKLQNRRRRRRRTEEEEEEEGVILPLENLQEFFLGSLQSYFVRSFLSWIYSTTCIKKETW